MEDEYKIWKPYSNYIDEGRLTIFIRNTCTMGNPLLQFFDDDPEDIEKKYTYDQDNTESCQDMKDFFHSVTNMDDKILDGLFKELLSIAREMVGFDGSSQDHHDAVIDLVNAFRNCETLNQTINMQFQHVLSEKSTKQAFDIVRELIESVPRSQVDDFFDTCTLEILQNAEQFDCEQTLNESQPLPASYYVLDCKPKKVANFDLRQKQQNGYIAMQEMAFLQQEIKRFGNSSGISQEDTMDTILLLIDTCSTNDVLYEELLDLVGYAYMDLAKFIITNKIEIAGIKPPTVSKHSNEGTKVPKYLQMVTVQSETEKMLEKQIAKDEKKIKKQENIFKNFDEIKYIDPRTMKSERELQLQEARKAPLIQNSSRYVPISTSLADLPHVYDSFAVAKTSAAFISGRQLKLPENHTRIDNTKFEEIRIPAVPRAKTDAKNLVPICSLDEVGQKIFSSLKTLNEIQSLVFETAYYSNENMLVCAPTGAGKTNVALLTIVHQIRNNMAGITINKEFKIIYVAPMKALAAEMVANFSKRLKPIGIQVRELTGDMQLSKRELSETQIVVTTPEKWDIMTRKGTGDTALSLQVKLLIIDEVHLLDGDRGPVLEALVARTLRQIETSQSMIRIVGLSATLPSYLDVGRFLRVNPKVGLFYFDDNFRPVPLTKTFIGIKNTNIAMYMKEMNEVCFDKVISHLQKKQQVMIFVHSRHSTLTTALDFIRMSKERDLVSLFTKQENSAEYIAARKQMSKSQNKKLSELFDSGLAIHHAGMLRIDRNYVEKFFREGLVKVLICTSTLAWGVNLPARAVIIKGTEIYDSKHGTYVKLGVLDVMQIFGRAGRPQFDKEGEGIIVTNHCNLSHYLTLLTRQHDIESNFSKNIEDNLNAEVALGTVSNVNEGVEWLSYTYFFIRMKSNPLAYGLKYNNVLEDADLFKFRKQLVTKAAKQLSNTNMVCFNEETGYMQCTDLGRAASFYYINCATVSIFMCELNKTAFICEEDIFAMISKSNEFDQLKVREEDMVELDSLLHSSCYVQAKGGCANTEGKVNILIQTYLSRGEIKGSSLISDQAYVIQNATRIARFLFEVSLKKGWAMRSAQFLKTCLMLERQQWYFATPLRQFSDKLSFDTLGRLDKKEIDMEDMVSFDSKEIGARTQCYRDRHMIKKLCHNIPKINIESSVQPITDHILRVTLTVIPDFTWDDSVHRGREAFWIWIEDSDTDYIYHSEFFHLAKKQVISGEEHHLMFTIPLPHSIAYCTYLVRAISDRWLGSDWEFTVQFNKMILPEHHQPKTELLNLHPLPIQALRNPEYEKLYKFEFFNAVQSQIFHTLYHTNNNVLLGAPTGSGKTIAAEIAIFRVFNKTPGMKVVYIAPLKALVRERIADWKERFERRLKKSVVELTGDETPDTSVIKKADVIVTTPEKWDGISRCWHSREYVRTIALIVIDEIHLLGETRGPVLEVIVSRTNFISAHTTKTIRIVGLSTAIANAQDLGYWLNIKKVGLYNFNPSVRPVPLDVHVSGYPGLHYCPRMALMNKPTFQAIKIHSPTKPSLVFVASRRQTRTTAFEMIAYLAAEGNPRQWLNIPYEEAETCTALVIDTNLRLTLAFGIGLHHAGLHENDRKLVEKLFLTQKIQVVIATATLAWGVNLPAHLVVVKGTEYFDAKKKRYVDFPITDVLQMIGRAGRPQFDSQGIAVVLVQDVKKDFYRKFLYEPFPVESSLLEVLPEHLNAEIVAGTLTSKQQCVDYMTWTYFYRRLIKNPSYYALEDTHANTVNYYLTDLINKTLEILYAAHCIDIDTPYQEVKSTVLGQVASYYYLSHKTLYMFKSNLTKNIDMDKILWILCEAAEYDELPVRHNEGTLNLELAKKCRVAVNPCVIDNPHTKASLLLQAHFSRLSLPISDYNTDLKTVLDQAIRIVQAQIDVCCDRGFLTAAISSMLLLQMILQGCWYDDNALLILPHIEKYHLRCFRDNKMETGREFPPWVRRKHIKDLHVLIESVAGSYREVTNYLNEKLNVKQIQDVYNTLKQLPMIEVSSTLAGRFEDEAVHSLPISLHKLLPSENTITRMPESYIRKIFANETYQLKISLKRLNAARTDKSALTPRFAKKKAEGWFLVWGNADTKELIAMKRISYVWKQSSYELTFLAPEVPGHVIYKLFLISDSYVGFDQQFDIHFNVVQNEAMKYEDTDSSDSEIDFNNLSKDVT